MMGAATPTDSCAFCQSRPVFPGYAYCGRSCGAKAKQAAAGAAATADDAAARSPAAAPAAAAAAAVATPSELDNSATGCPYPVAFVLALLQQERPDGRDNDDLVQFGHDAAGLQPLGLAELTAEELLRRGKATAVPGTGAAATAACFTCGAVGHMARACPSGVRGRGGQYKYPTLDQSLRQAIISRARQVHSELEQSLQTEELYLGIYEDAPRVELLQLRSKWPVFAYTAALAGPGLIPTRFERDDSRRVTRHFFQWRDRLLQVTDRCHLPSVSYNVDGIRGSRD